MQLQFSKHVAVDMACTHAHHEPDGTTYLMGISLMGRAKYNIIKVPPPHPTQKGVYIVETANGLYIVN